MNDSRRLDNDAQASAAPGEAAAYASLSQLVYADRPTADTLEKLTGLAKQVLAEHPEVSLTLLEGGEGASSPASSGQLALHLDEHQYDTRIGPCLDAALYSEAISLTMTGPDQPYPDFRHAARRVGVTHTLSIGLSTGDHALGALNIYSSTGRPFSEDSDRIAKTVATCVAIVLANADRYRRAATHAAQLKLALQSRACIDQAKGILIARHHCSSDEAFQMLIRQSQQQNVKLRQIAQDLVEKATHA